MPTKYSSLDMALDDTHHSGLRRCDSKSRHQPCGIVRPAPLNDDNIGQALGDHAHVPNQWFEKNARRPKSSSFPNASLAGPSREDSGYLSEDTKRIDRELAQWSSLFPVPCESPQPLENFPIWSGGSGAGISSFGDNYPSSSPLASPSNSWGMVGQPGAVHDGHEFDVGQRMLEIGRQTQEPDTFAPIDPRPSPIRCAHLQPVPQAPYVQVTSGARFTQLPPIDFIIEGEGVPLHKVFDRTARLPEGWSNEPAMYSEDLGQKIQLRLNWPGYPSLFKSIYAKDFTKTTRPVSKAKLVENVAKAMQSMMEALKDYKTANSDWHIGEKGIKFEDVVLSSLQHRAKGSWQAELYVRRKD